MDYRQLGTTDMRIIRVSFGTWALGGDWGQVTEKEATAALHHAIDQRVNFFDTAALKWLLQQEGVSTVIPGFKSIDQVDQNLASLSAQPFSPEELKQLETFYWSQVHTHIRGPY